MYFPNISLVCASSPGKAPKKNPEIGININSNGIKSARHNGKSFGLFGLWILSKKIIITKNTNAIVRINDETFGIVYPNAVLPNAGLRRVGTVKPIVIMNQLTGHKKCAMST